MEKISCDLFKGSEHISKNRLIRICLLALIPASILYTIPGIPTNVSTGFRYALAIIISFYPMLMNEFKVKNMQSITWLVIITVMMSTLPSFFLSDLTSLLKFIFYNLLLLLFLNAITISLSTKTACQEFLHDAAKMYAISCCVLAAILFFKGSSNSTFFYGSNIPISLNEGGLAGSRTSTGLILSLGFPFLLILVNKSLLQKLLAIMGIVSVVYVLTTVGARAGLLCVTLSIVGYLLLNLRRTWILSLALVPFVPFLVSELLLELTFGLTFQVLAAETDFINRFSSGRVELVSEAVELVKLSPLIGYGSGSDLSFISNLNQPHHSHNTFLALALSHGVIFPLGLIFLLAFSLKKALVLNFSTESKEDKHLSAIFSSLILISCAMAFSEPIALYGSLFTNYPALLLFFTILVTINKIEI